MVQPPVDATLKELAGKLEPGDTSSTVATVLHR
jgi:hypothetical protein